MCDPLAGAENAGMQTSADYILENMSGHMADQLREEVEEAPKPKVTEVEAAIGRVVGVIRQMKTAGELLFTSKEEEEAS